MTVAPSGLSGNGVKDLIKGFSIEVMPRTAAKIASFRALLPVETRIYVAHLEGTPIEDMIATARRLRQEGFAVMPHIPARMIADAAELKSWVQRYAEEAGVDEALVIAGGASRPVGAFENSMQLLETGFFDKFGFQRLHCAGHPEGNSDVDPDGTTRQVDEALRWKQAFSERTDARMALVTQFVFEAEPVVNWAQRIYAAGIDLPVHVGIAGPARLPTLLKYALACGVGPSLRVLQRRARDMTRLARPFEPTGVLSDLAAMLEPAPVRNIKQVHVFPFGGVEASMRYMQTMSKTVVS